MKGRILRELHKMAANQKSDYIAFLQSKTRNDESVIREKARFILNLLLHNYSHFTITTIDSFFQKVIRSFAHELGLFSGFEVETDTDTVLNESVEQLFRKTTTDEKLRKWLVRFAENKIEGARSWDLRNDILRLGREIHKEIFKQIDPAYFKEVISRDAIDAVIPAMKTFAAGFENSMKQLAAQARPIMQRNGVTPDDFNGKTKSFAQIFGKITAGQTYEISKTVRNAVDNVDCWSTKSGPQKPRIDSAFHDGLNQLLKQIVEHSDNNIQAYNTVDIIFKNIYVLGIIADLIQEINDYTTDKNLFLLADSTAFLQKIIAGSDAPFIYEKTGSRVFHYMIDEFQDTSGMQWENFRPLIENSLAGNYRNWVVGDVKQSIYRWRNSDWTILSDKIFQQFPEETTAVHPLEDNWRSTENIISFNNVFFTCLRQSLQDELDNIIANNTMVGCQLTSFSNFFTNAYSDCIQKVPAHHKDGKGYVRMEFLEKEDWQDTALEKLIATVEQLQDTGYRLKDIAILIRDKKSGVEITNYFMQEKINRTGSYRYDVISSDALFLQNAPVVQWVVSLLRFLMDPADELNKAFLVNEYKDYLKIETDNTDIEIALEEFTEKNVKYKSMPVYELIDTIIVLFRLSNNISNMPYLQSFQDAVLQYGKKNTIDVASFLLWWDDFSSKQVISMPENQDAIRLMTIHASKGLEFKVVIIPFCDWDFVNPNSDSFIWAEPHEKPFDQFKLLPVQLTAAAGKSIFSYEYFKEQIYTKVDNLNLLYVAFTRAIEKLIIFTPQVEIKKESKSTGHLLTMFRNNMAFCTNLEMLDTSKLNFEQSEHSSVLEYGVNEPRTNIQEPESPSLEITGYKSASIEARKSKMVVSGEFRTLSSIGNNLRVKGNLYHAVFQQIKTIDDVDNAVTELVKRGLLPETETVFLIKEIKTLINNPKVKPWFTDTREVKTEADILLKTGKLNRPDRIMFGSNNVIVIDYKFGEQVEESHQRQVMNYKYKLQQMGYKNIEAFVWYVFLNKVVQASDKPVQGKLFE